MKASPRGSSVLEGWAVSKEKVAISWTMVCQNVGARKVEGAKGT